ncbi:MAG: division/cell wall cluster transcriptional repressor MraZ [Deltaproteobacteria bacterium]|nr:division/cell wall cluster transcriptional repressor MraZ [Deltaproteobacteria bacterium]MBW2124075.1 division/cell wall cluster transcriptional repressor MraZ [Deltaproteobacteria bacterium]
MAAERPRANKACSVVNMFRGKYEHTIDSKGRVKLPSRFWDVLQERYDENLIITNLDGCLSAYPLEEWNRVEEKIDALPGMKQEVRRFKRFFLGSAVDCGVDRQHRILIPPSLRQFAGLKRDIVLVGLINRFEIWAKDRLDPEMNLVRDNFEDIVAPLGEFGF